MRARAWLASKKMSVKTAVLTTHNKHLSLSYFHMHESRVSYSTMDSPHLLPLINKQSWCVFFLLFFSFYSAVAASEKSTIRACIHACVQTAMQCASLLPDILCISNSRAHYVYTTSVCANNKSQSWSRRQQQQLSSIATTGEEKQHILSLIHI